MTLCHCSSHEISKLLKVSISCVRKGMKNEPPHDKTNKMACVPSEDSDQSGHPPSLIRVLAVRIKKAWVLSYPLSAQRRLWSDWADAQADLSLCLAHMPFCWFCHEVAQIRMFCLWMFDCGIHFLLVLRLHKFNFVIYKIRLCPT